MTRVKMMNKYVLILLFSACVLDVFAQAQPRSVNDDTSNSISKFQEDIEWVTLDEKTYSLDYPSDWRIDQTDEFGSLLYVMSPLSSPLDLFKENVNLLTEDLKGLDLDLDSYFNMSMQHAHMMYPDLKVIDDVKITIDGAEFRKVICTAKFDTYDLKFIQLSSVQHERAFVLTFTCQESTFDTYQSIGEKILASFKLNDVYVKSE